jgi:hypothetical protein
LLLIDSRIDLLCQRRCAKVKSVRAKQAIWLPSASFRYDINLLLAFDLDCCYLATTQATYNNKDFFLFANASAARNRRWSFDETTNPKAPAMNSRDLQNGLG